MNYPKISIVTPSYNQGQFIEETLKSVLAQEGDFYLDYIVMDGGSQDNSIEIIKKYEQLLKDGQWPVGCRGIQYRWVSERDKGQTDAINKGFDLSTGEILAWLNSDDTYLPGAVKKAVDFFAVHASVGMFYGKSYYVDSSSKIVGEYPTGEFDLKRIAEFNFISQPSAFFKREVFLAVGGLNTELNYTMDYDLWLRITKKYRAEYLPEFMSTFRLHGKSKTISDSHVVEFMQEILNIVMKYYQRAPLNRVYGYCYNRLLSRLPLALRRFTPIVVLGALILTVKEYLKLNRGIRREDLKLITPDNLKKFFAGSDGRPGC